MAVERFRHSINQPGWLPAAAHFNYKTPGCQSFIADNPGSVRKLGLADYCNDARPNDLLRTETLTSRALRGGVGLEFQTR